MGRIRYGALFISLLVSIIAGCTKDKDNSDSGISGKWYLKKITDIYYENGIKRAEEISDDFDSGYYSEFRNDGTGTSTFHFNDETNTKGLYEFSYEYDRGQKKLSLTGVSDQTTRRFDVTLITTGQLVLFSDLSVDLGNNTTGRETAEIIFNR